jgi:hypothetical protein
MDCGQRDINLLWTGVDFCKILTDDTYLLWNYKDLYEISCVCVCGFQPKQLIYFSCMLKSISIYFFE